MQKERNAFFEATQDLRQEIYQKNLELRSELAKKDPDAKKAAKLQREISKLEADFDQKRLDHQMKMRKISPKVGRGFMGGRTMGPGMMGYEGYGCPHYLSSVGLVPAGTQLNSYMREKTIACPRRPCAGGAMISLLLATHGLRRDKPGPGPKGLSSRIL